MAGLFSIFEIGKLALLANQQALQVVGQNLANVNTPGYSRQQAVLQETEPNSLGNFQLGTGVEVAQIRRVVNLFVEAQINVSQQDLGRLEAQADSLSRLESVFPSDERSGLNKDLNDFFSALRDFSNNPTGRTERTVLLNKAATLASDFKQAGTSLEQIRTDLNTHLSQTVTEVNGLASRIALLNGKIASAEIGGQTANDFRDQRGQLLNDLAKRIEIHTFEDNSGQIQVFIGRGQTLVERNLTFAIGTTPSADNGGLFNITYKGEDITSLIGNGGLKGVLLLRDSTIPDVLDKINTLAASLVNEVNQVHRLGFGLDGTSGVDFFSPLTVSARGKGLNAGTATIGSGVVVAPSLLSQHEYEIRFSSATAYSIVDTSTGGTVKGNYTGTVMTAPTTDVPVNIITGTNDTLALSVDGTASGVITLTGAASPGQAYSSGATLATEIQSQINADAALVAAGKSVTVIYETNTNRFVITSNSTASTSAVDVTGGTARATLGLAAGTSTAASGTYGNPQTFTIDGIQVQISGTPAADDVFTVSTRTDAAKSIAVAVTDENKIAASGTQAGIPGNNSTALALIALQSKALAALGGTTFATYYGATASAVGATTQTNIQNLSTQEGVTVQLNTLRGQTSGVSTDEELANLLQFQHSYQAAARIVVVADEMFQTLLDMKK